MSATWRCPACGAVADLADNAGTLNCPACTCQVRLVRPPVTPNDPLRTSDHEPSPQAGLDATTDLPPTSVPVDGGTAAFVPGQVTESERAASVVAVPGYEILRVLGRGGMGVVYQARHLALKRIVALKMILAGGHAGPQELARFRLEAEAVARLQHPNIVQVFEVGESEGHPFCALEFVDGGTLASKINGQGLPGLDAARLVETLARAVQLAHSRNVVHRDLKPANVLLASDGVPKITDFGLARQTDNGSGETQAGAIMGTPSYMAPEQASGRTREAGPAADIYSLGAILYECLTGRPPFRGQTLVETLDLVRSQEPVPPTHWQKKVPPDLETICLKCLRKEPEQRYTSAAELADDLVRWQQGEPIRARPVGSVERAVKWVQRNPVPTAAAVAVVLALVAGATVSYLGYREAVEQANIAKNNEETATQQTALAVQRANERDREAVRANREAVLAKGALHTNQIYLAFQAREQFDYPRVAQLLTEIRPEYQQVWETRYLRNLWLKEARPRRVFAGHTDRVVSVCFSPDGKTVLTASHDKTARLSDATTGQELFVLRGHTKEILSACFSPDGKTVLTGSKDHTARLWDAETGKEKAVLTGHTDQVVSLGFRLDGQRVLTGSTDSTARAWDAQTGQEKVLFKGHTGSVVYVSFSPDGKTVLTGSATLFTRGRDLGRTDNTARLWDAQTGQEKATLKSHRGSLWSVCFSPDGQRVLTGGEDKTARLWDAQTGQEKGVFQGTHYITSACFSPDGKRVLTLSAEYPARLWDTQTGRENTALKGQTGVITNACFSPDGQRILTDGISGARLWDVKTGKALAAFKGGGRICFSPDGQSVLIGGPDGTVQLWDAETAEERSTLKGSLTRVFGVCFSPDSRSVLAGGPDGTARLLDAETGREKVVFKGRPRREGTGGLVLFSPDGKRVLTGGEQIDARLWDAETGQDVADLAHTLSITAACFSPDGKRLLTGSGVVQRVLGQAMISQGADTTARLWDAETGRELAVLNHGGQVASVCFSPDGKTALTGSGNGARLWDVQTGQEQLVLKGGGGTGACFSPDGKHVLAGSHDGTARLWDAVTGQEQAALKGHTGEVRAVAYSPDGKHVLTGSKDRTARLWDAMTGEEHAVLKGHRNWVESVCFSPDSQRVLTGSSDGTTRLWDTQTGLEKVVLPGGNRWALFSPDGHCILTWGLSGGAARLWDGQPSLEMAPPK
jgi:WD40 repeat protein